MCVRRGRVAARGWMAALRHAAAGRRRAAVSSIGERAARATGTAARAAGQLAARARPAACSRHAFELDRRARSVRCRPARSARPAGFCGRHAKAAWRGAELRALTQQHAFDERRPPHRRLAPPLRRGIERLAPRRQSRRAHLGAGAAHALGCSQQIPRSAERGLSQHAARMRCARQTGAAAFGSRQLKRTRARSIGGGPESMSYPQRRADGFTFHVRVYTADAQEYT